MYQNITETRSSPRKAFSRSTLRPGPTTLCLLLAGALINFSTRDFALFSAKSNYGFQKHLWKIFLIFYNQNFALSVKNAKNQLAEWTQLITNFFNKNERTTACSHEVWAEIWLKTKSIFFQASNIILRSKNKTNIGVFFVWISSLFNIFKQEITHILC